MTATYRIKQFDEVFIKRDALRQGVKARRLRLPWISVPTDLQKRSAQRLANHPQGCEIYGAFILMASISAKATQTTDLGILADDEGHPYTPEDMEVMTGFPAASFALALEVLSSPRIGWLEVVPAGKKPLPAGKIPEPAGRKPDVAGNMPARSRILPADGTGRDGTGRDETRQRTSAHRIIEEDPDPEEVFSSKGKAKTETVLSNPETDALSLSPFVKWTAKDPERTQQNLDQLVISVRAFGIATCRRVAEYACVAAKVKLWPDELAEALEADASPAQISQEAKAASDHHQARERVCREGTRRLIKHLGWRKVLELTEWPPETVRDAETLQATLDGDLQKSEQLLAIKVSA